MSKAEKQKYHAFHGKDFSVRKVNAFAAVQYGELADWPIIIKQEAGALLRRLLAGFICR